ncbi:MAG: STAS domain-containing protein [Magnetococcus sp. YQC-5]
MIVDINEQEWIVRFKGKKITFRAYRTFSKWIEKIKNSGETIILFDMSGIQQIDSSALALFLQFFQAMDQEQHSVQILNATPSIQKNLDELLAIVDAHPHHNAIVAKQTHTKQLFNKVMRARTTQIRRKNEQEDPIQPQETSPDTTDFAQKRQLMSTFLKRTSPTHPKKSTH